MANPKTVHGVGSNDDMDPALLRRDTRTFIQKFHNFYSDNGPAVVVAIGIIILLNSLVPMGPKIPELLFGFGLFSISYTKKKKRGYPLVDPIPTNRPDLRKSDMEDMGLYLVGNEYDHSGQLWLTSSEFRTHILCLGTTGSGKTRFLLGLMYQAMLSGTGCMYVDGKGDNTVFWLVYSFCRRTDRLDDLLLINYLTGGKSLSNKKMNIKLEDRKISNTTNPLSQGTPEQLRSLLVGLMRESGGEGEMWKGRSSSMLKALLETLVYLRDNGEINLDIDAVRNNMVLDRILELTQRDDLPELAKIPLKKYLLELPGFTEEDAALNNINPECYKQHNFLTMQLTEVMSDLSGTYGHIFRAELGEVDFKDLVFNSRILFVMLPALEKDPDALGGLGKMIIAGVRAALAPALGEHVEGSYSSVISVKPTNALEPFMLILDEYGYYAVKGFSVAAAQARSLGVGIVFAGQDYPSFTKASKEEAEAILANTTTKIGMKLEDTGETAQKLVDRAAKGKVSQSEGHEKKGESDKMKDRGSARFEEVQRINVRDMVNQAAGEAHIIRGDEVYRGRLFYADPYEVSKSELNKFLMVNGPSAMLKESINGTFEKLQALAENPGQEGGSTNQKLKVDNGIKSLFDDYAYIQSNNKTGSEAATVAVGASSLYSTLKDRIAESAQKTALNPAPSGEAPEKGSEKSAAPEQQPSKAPKKKAGPSSTNNSPNASSSGAHQEVPSAVAEKAAEAEEAQRQRIEALEQASDAASVDDKARRVSREFTQMLTDAIVSHHEEQSREPMSAMDLKKVRPDEQIESISSGAASSEQTMDVISHKTRAYPQEKPSQAQDPESLNKVLDEIRNSIRQKETS